MGRKPSILDVDWQHENFEPQSKHDLYHPLGGNPPEAKQPESVFDIDWHPDRRSSIEGSGEDEEVNKELDVDPNTQVTDTLPQQQAVAEVGQELRQESGDVQVAQMQVQLQKLMNEKATLEQERNALKNALTAAQTA